MRLASNNKNNRAHNASIQSERKTEFFFFFFIHFDTFSFIKSMLSLVWRFSLSLSPSHSTSRFKLFRYFGVCWLVGVHVRWDGKCALVLCFVITQSSTCRAYTHNYTFGSVLLCIMMVHGDDVQPQLRVHFCCIFAGLNSHSLAEKSLSMRCKEFLHLIEDRQRTATTFLCLLSPSSSSSSSFNVHTQTLGLDPLHSIEMWYCTNIRRSNTRTHCAREVRWR